MAYIDLIDSVGKDLRFLLPDDGSAVIIGSGEDCHISLPHIPDMLPQHCIISIQPEGRVLSPAVEGATILAEGNPVQAVVLMPHVVYSLGSTMLMYNDEATAAPETATTAQEVTQEPESEPEKAAPRKKKKKKKAKHTQVTTVVQTVEDGVIHIILRRLYVIAILALAFLAGLTIRCWMTSGEYFIDKLLK